MSQKNERYASDMTEDQWALIKPLLPLEPSGPGRRITIDMQEAVNGMFYVCRTGCQWRALPTDFPNWNSVYTLAVGRIVADENGDVVFAAGQNGEALQE